MRKSWRKEIIGALSACLLATCALGANEMGGLLHTVTAQAATSDWELTGTCGEKATWEYDRNTNTLTIGGSGKMNCETDSYSKMWYAYKEKVKKVIIGDKITEIDKSAFEDGHEIEEVQFGTGVKIIGHKAFEGCISLKKIEIGGNIEEIGWGAFQYCSSLTDVYIGKNVKLVWWDVFNECDALKNIKIDEQNTNILVEGNEIKNAGISGACGNPSYGNYGDKGYGSYGVKYTYDEATKTLTISGNGSIYEGNKIYGVGKGYYYENFLFLSSHKEMITQNMETLVIGDGIVDIGDYSFINCKALKEVKLGKNANTIGIGTFKNCTALKSVTWNEKLTGIASDAFASCGNLQKVYVGKEMKSIGDSAFVGCYGLKQIKVHKSNKYFSMQGNLLLNKKLTRLVWGNFGSDTSCRISSKVQNINKYVLKIKTIENFIVNSKNKKFSSKNGLLYSKNGKILYLCPRGKKGTATVSAKATKVDSLLGSYAFQNCTKLQKIVIGKNVKTLPTDSFSGCNNLKTVQVNKNNKYYTSKGGAIFAKKNNKLICCYATENGTYTVPAGVTLIDPYAFSYCTSLKHLVLSDALTNYQPECMSGDYGIKTKLESITLGKNYYNDNICFLAKSSYLKNIYVSEKNPYYSSVDGILCNKEQTKILACPRNRETFKMPDTVTSVARNAVYSNESIKELYVSDKVMAIADELKQCTGLKKLYIGKNVRAIQRSLLTELQEISVNPESLYYKVEDGMLYTKDGNSLVWCPEQSQGKVTVVSGTAVIEEGAFYGCGKVTDIVFPSTVAKIEDDAFADMLEGNDNGKEIIFWVPTGMKEYYQSLLTSKTGFKDGMIIKEMEQ